MLIVVETIFIHQKRHRNMRWHKNSFHQHHCAQWLGNSFEKENSTITHSTQAIWWEIVSVFLLSWCSMDKKEFDFTFASTFSTQTLFRFPFRCILDFWCLSGGRNYFCSQLEYSWCWLFCSGALSTRRMWITMTSTRDSQ